MNTSDPAGGNGLTDGQLDALLESAGQELLHHLQARTDPTAALAGFMAARAGAGTGSGALLGAGSEPGRPALWRRISNPGWLRRSRQALRTALARLRGRRGMSLAALGICAMAAAVFTVGPSVVTTGVPRASASGELETQQGPAPVSVVQAYFAAINKHHLRAAWRIGGMNDGISYASFVSEFSGIAHISPVILSARGGTVSVRMSVLHANGENKLLTGTYTVAAGTIVTFLLHPVAGILLHPA